MTCDPDPGYGQRESNGFWGALGGPCCWCFLLRFSGSSSCLISPFSFLWRGTGELGHVSVQRVCMLTYQGGEEQSLRINTYFRIGSWWLVGCWWGRRGTFRRAVVVTLDPWDPLLRTRGLRAPSWSKSQLRYLNYVLLPAVLVYGPLLLSPPGGAGGGGRRWGRRLSPRTRQGDRHHRDQRALYSYDSHRLHFWSLSTPRGQGWRARR